jgi:hypothetical protein
MSVQPAPGSQRSSATDPGATLIAALAERDFDRLASALAPDVRMRALLPPGVVDVSGAEATAAKFAFWFGGAERLELLRSACYEMSDRLHVSYRLRVQKSGEPSKVVEQHLLCALDDGCITALDLVCSGFRPNTTEGGNSCASYS